MKSVFACLFLCSWAILDAQHPMPLDSLTFQFEKVKEICNRDGGRLWGKSLYGPILVIDRMTRMIVANQPDSEGRLKKTGNLYMGNYPEKNIVSCGVTRFGGRSWSVITWPFTEKDTFELYRTYIHESFHRIQEELGFKCDGYDNDHMDHLEARIDLNMEWQALLKAVASADNERNRSIRDALLFRQARRRLYPGAAVNEGRFELHEGLADYTSFKLCSHSETGLKEQLLRYKDWFVNNPGSCVRTFGYFSGFLYAYLLDETGCSWRKTLKCGDDLGLLLQQVLKIDLAADTANWFDQSKSRYPYMEITRIESGIRDQKEKVLSEYRARFLQNPVVKIPLISAGFGIHCSPQPLDTLGKVYPVIDISDAWGVLHVSENGCLLSECATVSAEGIILDQQVIHGQGWTLKMNDNWIIVKRGKDYLVIEKDSDTVR